MDDQDAFGAWLRRQRKTQDLSREALARRAHCSASMVRRLEAGELRPSPELALSLAAALNVPPAEQEAFVRFARGDAAAYPPTASPPTASPTPPPATHLPAPLTSLVGRKQEVTAVSDLLHEEGVRLLTLSGPPGVGKTRLSIAAANRLAESGLFPDGVYFVPLAPISEPPLVVTAVAQVLGVREIPGSGQPLYATLKTFLSGKRLLLVLDNFEQVTAAAPFVTDWLAAAAGLKVLVTSRELLHLYGEYEFPVPPLPLPDVNNLPVTPASAFYGRYAAIQLFKERARAARLEFQLTPENMADVAHICAWLDGLPLAIEMAAAQTKWLPPHQILDQLRDRLAALTGGPRDLSPRQQSLSGAIEWSYTLLGAGQRWLFDTLGVFVGGCDLEAVTAISVALNAGVTGHLSPAENLPDSQTIRSHLQLLVEKSLLLYEVTAVGEVRFEMLASLHEYARQQLQASGRLEATRQAHAHHYRQLAQMGSAHISQGGDQSAWMKRLELEHNNFRAALTWATETPTRAPFAMQLAQTMCDFWDTRGYIQEGRHWLETVLALDSTPSQIRGHLLNDVGWLARLQGDLVAARTLQEQALAIQETIGDEVGLSRSLENLAILASSQANLAEASTLLERSLAVRRRLGDPAQLLSTLNNLAIVAWQLQEYGRAEALYHEVELISREMQNTRVLSRGLHGRGTVQLSLGDYAGALASFQETVRIRQELGDQPGLINSLGGAAEAMQHLGDPVTAVRLIAASYKLQQAIGKVSAPAAQAEAEENLALLQAQMGEVAFNQAWAEGETLSVVEAVGIVMRNP
ncbi:MAG: tetratricopeptide repeat protein [Anaerolineae bacterium]|nr:tetratricopeptide repeat protein [Anaerolineae bacterium]